MALCAQPQRHPAGHPHPRAGTRTHERSSTHSDGADTALYWRRAAVCASRSAHRMRQQVLLARSRSNQSSAKSLRLSIAQLHGRAVTPNPSLERDLHRHGTWPARRSLPSSASRAKRHTGVGPSAQTLGLAVTPLALFWQQAPTAHAGKRCLLRCPGLPSPASSQSVGGMPAPRSLCCPWLPRLLSRSRLSSQSNNAAPNRTNRWRYTQSAAPRSTLFRGGGASGSSCGQECQALVHRLRQVFLHLAGEPNFHWSGQPPASRLGRVALLFYAAPRGQVAFPASAAQLNVRPHKRNRRRRPTRAYCSKLTRHPR